MRTLRVRRVTDLWTWQASMTETWPWPCGLYRTREPVGDVPVHALVCCPKRRRRFEVDSLPKLGHDAASTPTLFVPELLGGFWWYW